jgi:hypothetical protein
MRRSDGALEVRLRHDESHTLVGWLTSYPMFDHTRTAIQFATIKRIDGPHDWDDDIIDEHTYVLTEMNHVITKRELAAAKSEGACLRNIPLNALKKHVIRQDAWLFTWQALLIDMPNYELLFDLSDFEPTDISEH